MKKKRNKLLNISFILSLIGLILVICLIPTLLITRANKLFKIKNEIYPTNKFYIAINYMEYASFFPFCNNYTNRRINEELEINYLKYQEYINPIKKNVLNSEKKILNKEKDSLIKLYPSKQTEIELKYNDTIKNLNWKFHLKDSSIINNLNKWEKFLSLKKTKKYNYGK